MLRSAVQLLLIGGASGLALRGLRRLRSGAVRLSTDASAPSIELKYFNIEGAAEKVRLAFVIGGIPFSDVRVPFDQWGANHTVRPAPDHVY